jgi:hypothetical protein
VRWIAVVIGALALTASADAAPPRVGVLVPGERLGGIPLGASPARVRALWGARNGVCRSCFSPTWYFNYRRFEPQGAAVSFSRGRRRVTGVYTLWSPRGWRTSAGLVVGDSVARATELYGPLARVECGTYYALTMPGKKGVSAIYVSDEKVWGFGLFARGRPICR